MTDRPTVIVITGPTASGKTSLAIELAETFGGEIISADSRQAYAEIPVSTAAPTPGELARVPHRFVGHLALERRWSAGEFAQQAAEAIAEIHSRGRVPIVCGGSMMYIDALCRGMDDIPDVDDDLRRRCVELWEREGTQAIVERLGEVDPQYLLMADISNHKRLIHALEVSLQAGRPYSSILTHGAQSYVASRPFDVLMMAIGYEREVLFSRIASRVDDMMACGLADEARRVYDRRALNSLNTVGLKEMFDYIEGRMTLDATREKIARNTRVYAKKQITWMHRLSALFVLPSSGAYGVACRLYRDRVSGKSM